MISLIKELTQSGRCFRKKPAGCVQGDSGDQGTKLEVVAAQPQVWQMGWREVMRTHSAPPAWIPRIPLDPQDPQAQLPIHTHLHVHAHTTHVLGTYTPALGLIRACSLLESGWSAPPWLPVACLPHFYPGRTLRVDQLSGAGWRRPLH